MLSGYSNKEHKHLSNESQVKYQDYQSHMQGSKSMALTIKKKKESGWTMQHYVWKTFLSKRDNSTKHSLKKSNIFYYLTWNEMLRHWNNGEHF